ncbi:MAG: EAL domain-containing protein [Gammaproteobacteria bacterium]|nr:EAL domain-containing protein [Gammaproteobacteria bacterium]
MKNADLAMYRAKERGRDTYQFFSDDMNTRALGRLAMENELRIALRDDQFALDYQPKVRLLDTGRMVGLEALLRWHHPERGRLAPDAYIQIAPRRAV